MRGEAAASTISAWKAIVSRWISSGSSVRVIRRAISSTRSPRSGLARPIALAHGESVHEAEQLVGIPRRLLVEGVHERAPMQLDRDPALALERDERLADRDAADAEGLRDLLLGDPLTGTEPALEDQPPDVHGGVLAAALANQLPGEGSGSLAVWSRWPTVATIAYVMRRARTR